MTIIIPNFADFLNWAKLGILNNRGEIIPLYYNDKLTTYADLSADRKSKTTDGSHGWVILSLKKSLT